MAMPNFDRVHKILYRYLRVLRGTTKFPLLLYIINYINLCKYSKMYGGPYFTLTRDTGDQSKRAAWGNGICYVVLPLFPKTE